MNDTFARNLKLFFREFSLFLKEFKRLHIWLIKYRVVGVGVTVFACWLCLDAWLFYKNHYLEFNSIDQNSGLGLLIMAYITLLKFGLNNITDKHEGHEQT